MHGSCSEFNNELTSLIFVRFSDYLFQILLKLPGIQSIRMNIEYLWIQCLLLCLPSQYSFILIQLRLPKATRKAFLLLHLQQSKSFSNYNACVIFPLIFIKPFETLYSFSKPSFQLHATFVPLYEHFVSPPSPAFLTEVFPLFHYYSPPACLQIHQHPEADCKCKRMDER